MEIEALFGRRLRSIRSARGLTQQQLGEAADLSYKYLGAIERGEENPSLKVISKLASALGVEMRDLFEFEHEETSVTKVAAQGRPHAEGSRPGDAPAGGQAPARDAYLTFSSFATICAHASASDSLRACFRI